MSSRRALPTRRGFCFCCIGATTFAATGGWLTPRQAFAQARSIVDVIRDDAAGARIVVHRLRGNISVLVGSGGNIGVLTGADGTLLVDAGITATRPRILEALAMLGPEPVTRLVNTHWHFDHADGNEWLHAHGAAILAHENTLRHLSTVERVEDWDFTFPRAPEGALPTEVVGATGQIKANGQNVALRHHPAGHTDGDLAVTFVEADVVHAGDLYWNGGYPFIDNSTGGTIHGAIAAAEALLAATTDRTVIIPGHGHPASNRRELQAFRDMLAGVRDNVGRLKSQGRSLQDAIAAKPTAPFDDAWGRFIVGPELFTRVVYAGV